LSYYITCYVAYLCFLVAFLYVYVRVYADEPKPVINVVSGQPLLQMPGLTRSSVRFVCVCVCVCVCVSISFITVVFAL